MSTLQELLQQSVSPKLPDIYEYKQAMSLIPKEVEDFNNASRNNTALTDTYMQSIRQSILADKNNELSQVNKDVQNIITSLKKFNTSRQKDADKAVKEANLKRLKDGSEIVSRYPKSYRFDVTGDSTLDIAQSFADAPKGSLPSYVPKGKQETEFLDGIKDLNVAKKDINTYIDDPNISWDDPSRIELMKPDIEEQVNKTNAEVASTAYSLTIDQFEAMAADKVYYVDGYNQPLSFLEAIDPANDYPYSVAEEIRYEILSDIFVKLGLDKVPKRYLESNYYKPIFQWLDKVRIDEGASRNEKVVKAYKQNQQEKVYSIIQSAASPELLSGNPTTGGGLFQEWSGTNGLEGSVDKLIATLEEMRENPLIDLQPTDIAVLIYSDDYYNSTEKKFTNLDDWSKKNGSILKLNGYLNKLFKDLTSAKQLSDINNDNVIFEGTIVPRIQNAYKAYLEQSGGEAPDSVWVDNYITKLIKGHGKPGDKDYYVGLDNDKAFSAQFSMNFNPRHDAWQKILSLMPTKEQQDDTEILRRISSAWSDIIVLDPVKDSRLRGQILSKIEHLKGQLTSSVSKQKVSNINEQTLSTQQAAIQTAFSDDGTIGTIIKDKIDNKVISNHEAFKERVRNYFNTELAIANANDPASAVSIATDNTKAKLLQINSDLLREDLSRQLNTEEKENQRNNIANMNSIMTRYKTDGNTDEFLKKELPELPGILFAMNYAHMNNGTAPLFNDIAKHYKNLEGHDIYWMAQQHFANKEWTPEEVVLWQQEHPGVDPRNTYWMTKEGLANTEKIIDNTKRQLGFVNANQNVDTLSFEGLGLETPWTEGMLEDQRKNLWNNPTPMNFVNYAYTSGGDYEFLFQTAESRLANQGNKENHLVSNKGKSIESSVPISGLTIQELLPELKEIKPMEVGLYAFSGKDLTTYLPEYIKEKNIDITKQKFDLNFQKELLWYKMRTLANSNGNTYSSFNHEFRRMSRLNNKDKKRFNATLKAGMKIDSSALELLDTPELGETFFIEASPFHTSEALSPILLQYLEPLPTKKELKEQGVPVEKRIPNKKNIQFNTRTAPIQLGEA